MEIPGDSRDLRHEPKNIGSLLRTRRHKGGEDTGLLMQRTDVRRSVEVDQLMQRAEERLLKMAHERALRFLEKLCERCMNGYSR